ncbi:uncharacterized protein CEXT_141131 [Caerostris extrusa]|uniref:Uncharacterized protein n=1 Tax=Caerostris extrusa TaxID=172846 RepID=A0AAV4QLZ6_CAEEX|nr:uncharacterized protein CEXT_141131 [Caerostris extrusa]
MDSNLNPVIQERIVTDNIKKERVARERWMMNHGVKYFQHPFDYENFYGSGKSTATPGPRLTQAGYIPCCCRNLHDLSKDRHNLHCKEHDYWQHDRPVLEMKTDFRPKIQKQVFFDADRYRTIPKSSMPTRNKSEMKLKFG